jgi:nicotinamide-nucleotide amidase
MQAEIITIGDEILIGQIVDTNSAWIAQKLNEIGISLSQIKSISDNKLQIIKSLNDSFDQVNLILITGGLGPTNDDITKSTLATYFNSPLKMDHSVLKHVESLLKGRNVSMNELNIKQAEVPENCKVLHNSCGTAPGMWFEHNQKVLISMPGVPFEMKMMMEHEIIPLLKQRFSLPEIIHKTIITHGIAESTLAIQIAEWENNLPNCIKLAFLPSPGIVRLRLSAQGDDKKQLKNTIEGSIRPLREILKDAILSEDDESIEVIISKLLINNNKTLAVAESCTGGNIAHLMTLVPGSSAYFKGGVVAYSNEVKQSILGVMELLITEKGAVSEEVVECMAKNVATILGSNYGIGISGIAGPDGGSLDKPIGTVWISVYNGLKLVSRKFQFGDNRERNITRASIAALNMLRLLILEDVQKK